ncbi:lipid A deacylase LpxR family protein [Ohtaekwangia sp.]|uniref:lipid A deacylase LpxR family protein n=1 Tax=Ohtaekwangia sp. TaxID=2066019 RepID=UPI002FDD55AD
MKYIYASFIAIFMLMNLSVNAQKQERNHLFRVYEDNDFFNLIGNNTDRAYTNGTRFDFFQKAKTKQRSFLYKLWPKAGPSSTNFTGWSIAQLMVTPNDISVASYQSNDYRYSGALFVARSFYSYDPVRKFSFQTEALAGVRGPQAMAKQTQTVVHKMINSGVPQGWNNQLGTQALLNLTFTAERNLLAWKHIVELNAGVQGRVGSAMDAVLVYPVLRIGKMSPYFNGYIDQFGSYQDHGKPNKMQYYLILKPTSSFVAYNALLEGTRKDRFGDKVQANEIPLAHKVLDVQGGIVIAYGNLSASYLLTRSTAYEKGLYEHRFGTLELYYKW